MELHGRIQGRAVELSTDSTTQQYTERHGHFENTDIFSHVTTTKPESHVVDLFSISASEAKIGKKETKPFIHQIQLHGPQGEIVRV